MPPLVKSKKAPTPKSKEAKIAEKNALTDAGLRGLLEKVMYDVDKQIPLFTPQQNNILHGMRMPNGEYFMDKVRSYEFIGGCHRLRRIEENHNNSLKQEDIDAGIIKKKTGAIDDLIRVTIAEFELYSKDKSYVYSYIIGAPWYEEEDKADKEEIKSMKSKIVVKKGLNKCQVCINNHRDPTNTNTVTIQTRSGDEPPTQFNDCNTCGHRWRIG